jgi:hypothetical protein
LICIAGSRRGLRIRVLSPANAQLSALDWRSVDSSEFRSGWRLDISGGVSDKTGTYIVMLEDASN